MKRATADSRLARAVLIGLLVAFVIGFLLLPVGVVLMEAFRGGFAGYLAALGSPLSVSAVHWTLIVAAAVVPLNTVFGVAAAWCVSHFRFRGRSLLVSLIELPLWISPVVGGLTFALLFGRQGLLGAWLDAHNIQIMFAYPGMVLATAFVTFPFVARGLIPLMQQQGHDEEEAALTLGADSWQLFWRVSFPKIRWGVLYGMILCNARAMGEFGAVSIVAGSVDNRLTIPLQIEHFFLNMNISGAFALASLLLVLTAVTLAIKLALEWRRLAPNLLRPH